MAKQSFKDVASESARIIESIKAQKFAPIYLLMGEDSYYIDLISNYIIDHVLSVDEREFNQVILYGKETNGSTIVDQARRYPMMSPRQVVVVRQAQAMPGIEDLAYYAAKPLESTILVICYQGKSLDKRLTLYKSLSKVATIVETVQPRDYEISSWITDLFKIHNCSIEPKAVQMLADHIGADLQKIDHEVDKLLTRLPEGTRQVTAIDIEQNVGISKDYNVFELTRALSERNFKQALIIADHFAANPKDNPLVVTISLLFTHFQRIVTLNIHKWECKRANKPVSSDMDLAKLLKLPNAYFLSEYKTASNGYPNQRAFAILGLLRQWDGKSKGLDTGSIADGDLLKELILRISLL